MPKSKLRGGAKQHRKRVTARNQNFKGMWKRLQKQAWEKHSEWKQQQSGSTEDNQTMIQTDNG